MVHSRRIAIALLVGSTMPARQPPDVQEQEPRKKPPFPDLDEDAKLPNGKSQKDAIAEREHAEALKDAGRLIDLAQQVKGDLEKAGNYVVPLSTVKKTEEIERLAKRIRGRLKE